VSAEGTRLRVALIGCGRIGAHTPERLRATAPPGWIPVSHAQAIRSTPGLELVAVCDVEEEAARTTAAQLEVEAWFSDYREMIRALRPDLVSVATRTEGRCDAVEFAAANGVRGLHVEKPLGRSPAECRRAVGALERAGIPVTYGTTRRWMDVFRLAWRMAQSRELGELRQLTIEFGRAPLLWTHPHSFDLMVWFASRPDPVSVQASCALDPADVRGQLVDADPAVENAWVQFTDGFNAAITCAPGLNVRLAGDRGSLTVAADGARLTKQARTHADRPYFGPPQPVDFTAECSGTQRAFRELANAVLGRGLCGITPREILLSNLLGFACAWSSLQGGRRVCLEDVPDGLTITGRQAKNYA